VCGIICWKCGQVYIANDINLELGFPSCPNCHALIGGKEFEAKQFAPRKIIFPTNKETPVSGRLCLQVLSISIRAIRVEG